VDDSCILRREERGVGKKGGGRREMSRTMGE